MLKDGDAGAIVQRDKVSYAVVPHTPCGVVTPEILRKIAAVAEKYQAAAIKITSAQRLAIVGLSENDVKNVWSDLKMTAGAATGLCVRSIKACPGITFCKRGIKDSLKIGMELDSLYHGMKLPGKMKMGVSGCPIQCAETCIKDIGLVGFSKGWKLMIAGNGGILPRLSVELASELSDEQALAMVDKLVNFFRDHARPHQRMGLMIDRMGGIEEFKKAFFTESQTE